MGFLKQYSRPLAILFILLTGLIIVAPYSDFQDYLAQGDHGRDLYAAQAVYRGELPYKDFWWVYGPLTPYYYGMFFKIFGTHIGSMLLGKNILRILGGLFIGLAMMEIASPLAAILCAVWFMLFQQDFFFTYNHLAGIVMVLGIIYCLFSYIKTPAARSAWGSLGFIFALCLIKINFGLAALMVSLVTVGACDRVHRTAFNTGKKLFFTAGLVGLPLIVFTIYWSMLHGLSPMEIRQCLPYKEGDQPYTTNPWVAIVNFTEITLRTIFSNWTNAAFAVIINASALRCIFLLDQNRLNAEKRRIFLLSLALLGVFYAANAHEYLKSGVWYRIFWAQPLSILMIFLIIDTATQSVPQLVRKLVFTFLAILAVVCWFNVLKLVNTEKNENHYVSLPRGGIYVTNSPSWISTVKDTTSFLNKTLKPDELFFALPYDCLYYYLTDKKSPTRQLIFFEHIKIPPEQERAVIAELKARNVNYVLLSNRAFARQELGLGFLGKTYCPLIGKYIQDNFVPIARFGDWTNEPGWAWNHGTLILKRRER